MDNLIVTVIAVALVSAMTLLGVNYGTQAILVYQANVDAAKIVSDAERIASAWRSYARANNGDPSLTSTAGYCWKTGAQDLAPSYMSTMPTPPQGAADSTYNYYFPNVFAKFNVTISSSTVGSKYTPADSIALWIKSPRVCLAISNLAGQSTAVIGSTLQQTAGGSDVNLSTLSTPRAPANPYDCVYNGSGGPAQGNAMLFIYRVFDQNKFTTSTFVGC